MTSNLSALARRAFISFSACLQNPKPASVKSCWSQQQYTSVSGPGHTVHSFSPGDGPDDGSDRLSGVGVDITEGDFLTYIFRPRASQKKKQKRLSSPAAFSVSCRQSSKINKKQMDTEEDDITRDTPTFIL